MKLYELDAEIQRVEEEWEQMLIENEGEIVNEDLEKELNALKIEKDRKILGIGAWIKNLKSEADAIKAEEKALGQRRKVLENKSESLKKYVGMILKPGEKLSDSRVAYSWRKSTYLGCDLDDPIEDTPKEYLKTSYSVMSADIKQAIKDGIEVEGYELKERNNLQLK